MLLPLRMRGHANAVKMEYDERYAPYFRRARLLGFVLQFKRKPPTLVHLTLTALIDRWRPETHSFHLPCGEMTVTLYDWGDDYGPAARGSCSHRTSGEEELAR